MGYTSRDIDENLYYKDIELIITLEGMREEREIRKTASAVAMAFGGSKSGDNKNGRR
jgi:hypothetical protein